jgi:hypothetical protein
MKPATQLRHHPDSRSVSIPQMLSVSIGGHFGPSYSVELENGSLTYNHSRPVQQFPPKWDSRSEQIQPSDDRWQAFRRELDRLNVWRWQPKYFEPICDGTGWSAEIVYSDTVIRSHGSNCFPGKDGARISIVDRTKDDAFDKFCSAVSCLIGRKFR